MSKEKDKRSPKSARDQDVERGHIHNEPLTFRYDHGVRVEVSELSKKEQKRAQRAFEKATSGFRLRHDKPTRVISAKGFPEPMKFNSKERTSDPSTIGVYKTRIK